MCVCVCVCVYVCVRVCVCVGACMRVCVLLHVVLQNTLSPEEVYGFLKSSSDGKHCDGVQPQIKQTFTRDQYMTNAQTGQKLGPAMRLLLDQREYGETP